MASVFVLNHLLVSTVLQHLVLKPRIKLGSLPVCAVQRKLTFLLQIEFFFYIIIVYPRIVISFDFPLLFPGIQTEISELGLHKIGARRYFIQGTPSSGCVRHFLNRRQFVFFHSIHLSEQIGILSTFYRYIQKNKMQKAEGIFVIIGNGAMP